ncbi:hypothetical protein [Senegalimassilia anaerobia]|uniref:hypothetical protein n=1 Tax=Senegalimassilia anaerobia TaxID=1473216 RepID=UPI002675B3D6|nr:hypothetical protein [Senegalimassilia anaerobia]
MNEKSEGGSMFRRVGLAGGRAQIVPAEINLLNPQREGEAGYLYFVWPFVEGGRIDLDAAIKGQAPSPLSGYFTDYVDLYAMGRHDTPLLRPHFEEMKADFFELMELVVAAVEPDIPEGAKWSYAFCLCDCFGSEVPVGTGFGFQKGVH